MISNKICVTTSVNILYNRYGPIYETLSLPTIARFQSLRPTHQPAYQRPGKRATNDKRQLRRRR